MTDKPRNRAGLNASWSKTSTSMSNRRRVAMAAADQIKTMHNESLTGSVGLNDSESSLKSSNSQDGGRPRSSRRIRREKLTRRQRSTSPALIEGDEEDDGTINSMASGRRSDSRRDRESRSGSGSRSKSRSRSKSQKRSKSVKSRSRRTAPGRSASGSGLGQMVVNGRGGSRQNSTEGLQALYNNDSTDNFIPPMSPATRGGSQEFSQNSGKDDYVVSLPEGDKESPSNSQRFSRSMGVLDIDMDNSGRANRSVGGSRSQRRERTSVSSSKSRERTSSTREGSSSSFKRPPRSSRGVGRSKSDMGSGLSPRRSPRSGGGGSSEAPSRRMAPGRSKSASDDMGDLGDFFSRTAQVSRRSGKKTGSGSGARSVASMPVRSRRLRRNTSSDSKELPSANSSTRKPARRGSHDSFESDEEYDESIAESLEDDLNDIRKPSSSQSLSNFGEGSQSSLGALELEAALQMHMSRTENLLFDVFPKHIAEALRSGRKVEPENHECVTIFFCDIVGFTTISSELDPMKVSDMLDRLYNSFDALSHYHDVFKVETIGDAYMAVTNLTKAQPDHCKRIAEFAVDAIRVANQTLIDKDDPTRGFVNIRVGFHSGPVVSNVVGSRNPRFCLFGDSVNTASRMESNSEVNRIHCSHTSAELLKVQHPNLKLNPRGIIEVKGKGEMETFWVNEDAVVASERDGNTRSIFKMMKKGPNSKNR